MNTQYIVQGIFLTAGLVSLTASVCNWDWFFNARNMRFIVQNVGRNRARLFYGLLGVLLIACFLANLFI